MRLFRKNEVSTAEKITFAVTGSNSFHNLELSKTLIRFAEFDFTYFWEQCIEAGRNARKTGRISRKIEDIALASAAKCHPYVEACIGTEFSSLVLDCIIAYICHSEGIGLEDLWARCISPKSLYEKAIFNRVSEYKTGRGINQWINIVRLQEYARSKMKFIYETADNIMQKPEIYRTRREYFDLAFSVAANETGCPMAQMPSVKKYSPSQLPDSVFMMGRVSKNLYKRLSDVLSGAEMCQPGKLNDHNRDRAALDAFSYVKDMPRPGEIEMNFALEAISDIPETVYVPDSFKAVIDLEFTCMYEKGIYLSLCPSCGRYFVRSLDEKSPYCHRVTSSGKTCTEVIEEGFGIAASKNKDDKNTAPDNIPEADTDIAEEAAPADNNTEDKPVEEAEEEIKVRGPVSALEETYEPTEIPKELERRCQKIYNVLYRRIGRLMTAFEFKEWSKFLYDMKRDVRSGNADIAQLEDFLEYWETAARKQSKKLRRADKERYQQEEKEISASDDPYSRNMMLMEMAENQPSEDDALNAETVEDAPEEDTGSGIAPAGTEDTGGEKTFKPFNPPKYNTVLEAMLDGKYKSDELLNETGNDDGSEIKVNGKKVTLPQWERITRK